MTNTDLISKATLPASELLRMVRQVIPFVGKDKAAPILDNVLFQFSNDDLHLVTTDRYRAARARLTQGRNYAGDKFSVVVDATRMRDLISLLTKYDGDVEITFTGHENEDNELIEFKTTESAIILTTTGTDKYPLPIIRILDEAFQEVSYGVNGVPTTDNTSTGWAFNPQYLADLAKVAAAVPARERLDILGRYQPLLMLPTKTTDGLESAKGVAIMYGDTFEAVYMPVRVSTW